MSIHRTLLKFNKIGKMTLWRLQKKKFIPNRKVLLYFTNVFIVIVLMLTLIPVTKVQAASPLSLFVNGQSSITLGAPATYTVSWQTSPRFLIDQCTGSDGLSGHNNQMGEVILYSVGVGTYTYTMTCRYYSSGWKNITLSAIVYVVANTPTPTKTSTPSKTPTITFTPTPTNTATKTNTPGPTSTGTVSQTPSPTNTQTPLPTFTPTKTPVVAYPGTYEPGNAVFTGTAHLDISETPHKYWFGGGSSYYSTEQVNLNMTFNGGAVDIFYPYIPISRNSRVEDELSYPMGYSGLTIKVYLDGVLNTSFVSGKAGGVHVNTTPGLHTLKIENDPYPAEMRCGVITQVVVYSSPTPFTPTNTPSNTPTLTITPTPLPPTPSYPQIYSLNSNKSPWKIISGSLSQVTLSNTVTVKIPANGSVYYDVRRDNTVVKQVDVTVSQTTGACDMSLYYNGSLAYRQVIPGNPNAAAAGYPKFTIRPRPHATRIDTVMLKAGSGDCYVSNVTAYGVGVSVIPMVPTEEPIPVPN